MKDIAQPTALDDYLFDLRGYVVIPGALTRTEVDAMNACVDNMPSLEPNQWHGHVHRQLHEDKFGINLQQIYEAGSPFEDLIDHPSWIAYVRRYVGGEGTHDYHHGSVFIDENFYNIRGPGQAISLHSGAYPWVKRCQYHYVNGQFACGQVNVLMALTDIGPGDGATMVIPGSHKSNMRHPGIDMSTYGTASGDGVEGAIEVFLNAGDALLFVDAISHGSAERKNPGDRRITIYRYGPSWGNFRFGYTPSPGLLARLTPERSAIVQPLKMIPRL